MSDDSEPTLRMKGDQMHQCAAKDCKECSHWKKSNYTDCYWRRFKEFCTWHEQLK